MNCLRLAALGCASLVVAACQPGARVVDDPAVSVADVWAASPDDVWAVGATATGAFTGPVSTGPNLAHFDGVEWTPVGGLEGITLRGVWGAAADDVWAAGDSLGVPIIVHFDGSVWSLVDTGLAFGGTSSTFYDVSGSDADDVWVAGSTDASGMFGPLLLHFDGTTWTSVPVPSGPRDLIAAHVADGDLWMLDLNGTAWRARGSSWSEIPSDLSSDAAYRLRRIGEDQGSVWIGGAAGIAAFDGSRFVAIDTGDRTDLRGDDALLADGVPIYTTFTHRSTSCDFAGCETGFDTSRATLHVGAREYSIDSIAGEPSEFRERSLTSIRLFANDADLWALGPSYWRVAL